MKARYSTGHYAIVLAALWLGLAAAGCSKSTQAQGAAGGQAQGAEGSGRRQAAVTVQVMPASFGRLEATRTSAGVVTPAMQSQVAALVAGVVSSVGKRAGDWVSAGETVIQLDDTQLRIALANSQAALDTARINLQSIQDSTSQNNVRFALQVQSAQSTRDAAQKFYDSQKTLFDLGGLSASTLDTASAQLATAQAALESAKIALDQNQRGVATTANQNVEALKIAVTTATNNLQQAELNLRNAAIKVPFDGQIAVMNVSPGMYVSLNTAVFLLVSAERQVNFSIAPQDAPALPQGESLMFSYGGASHGVKVKQAPSAPVGGVVPMVVSGPAVRAFPFGVVGAVEYVVSLATGVLVPLTSLDTTDNRNYVYVVENGKIAIREVKVSGESGATAAVTGIDAGSMVVVSPPPGLVPGAAVQAVPAQGIRLGGSTRSSQAPASAAAPAGASGSGGFGGAQRAPGAAGAGGPGAPGGQSSGAARGSGRPGAAPGTEAATGGSTGQGQYSGQRGTRGQAPGQAPTAVGTPAASPAATSGAANAPPTGKP